MQQKAVYDAQTLFMIHNARLLDQTLVRRNQSWFAEKGKGAIWEDLELQEAKPRQRTSTSTGIK
jgi:hypothetical protein